MRGRRFIKYTGITFVASLMLLTVIAVTTGMERYQILAFAVGNLIVALVVAFVATSDRKDL